MFFDNDISLLTHYHPGQIRSSTVTFISYMYIIEECRTMKTNSQTEKLGRQTNFCTFYHITTLSTMSCCSDAENLRYKNSRYVAAIKGQKII